MKEKSMREYERPPVYDDHMGIDEIEVFSEPGPYVWLMRMFDQKLSHYRRVGKLALLEEVSPDPKRVAQVCGPPLSEVYNNIRQYLNLPEIGESDRTWVEATGFRDNPTVEYDLFSVARLATQVIDGHTAVQDKSVTRERYSDPGAVEEQLTYFNQLYSEICLVFGLAKPLEE